MVWHGNAHVACGMAGASMVWHDVRQAVGRNGGVMGLSLYRMRYAGGGRGSCSASRVAHRWNLEDAGLCERRRRSGSASAGGLVSTGQQ